MSSVTVLEAEEPPGALGEDAIEEGPKVEGRVSLVRWAASHQLLPLVSTCPAVAGIERRRCRGFPPLMNLTLITVTANGPQRAAGHQLSQATLESSILLGQR